MGGGGCPRLETCAETCALGNSDLLRMTAGERDGGMCFKIVNKFQRVCEFVNTESKPMIDCDGRVGLTLNAKRSGHFPPPRTASLGGDCSVRPRAAIMLSNETLDEAQPRTWHRTRPYTSVCESKSLIFRL